MAVDDHPAATEELQDEVAAMNLDPKPETEIDGESEVCALSAHICPAGNGPPRQKRVNETTCGSVLSS